MSLPASLSLITRILDEPGAVALVQSLDAQVLGRIIAQVGLEDAGGIITLATADQLAQIFDQDLWRNTAPGQPERFDPERFALWLEVMLETDPKLAARKLAELDENLVSMALFKQIWVLDREDLNRTLADPDDGSAPLLDKVLEASLNHEFSGYLAVARSDRSWEVALSLLAELNQDHAEAFDRLMHRLAILTRSEAEDHGGLYNILTDAEQLEDDVADARDQRRQEQGYIPPADAAHFLHLAQSLTGSEILKNPGDPISRAYFAAYAPTAQTRSAIRNSASANNMPRLADSLRETNIDLPCFPAQSADLPVQAPADPTVADLRGVLAQLAKHDPALHDRRILELSFLVNVLMAGASNQGRRYLPAEAAQTAIGICAKGLDRAADIKQGSSKVNLITELDAVKLFKLGWKFREATGRQAD